jgi:hypothetical protein
MIQDEPVLECNWDVLLNFVNSPDEIRRAKRLNKYVSDINYPLTRSFLNNHYDSTGHDKRSFSYDCAASMYSYYLMFYGYKVGSGSGALPASKGGQGVSFGTNPFFGLFNLDSPWLWILIALGIVIAVKK